MATSSTLQRPETGTARPRPVIAIAGNPNTGKSTVFNALCGTRQKVANYPGVTVEKKMGYFRPGDAAKPSGAPASARPSPPLAGEIEVIDLPGLYSLSAVSPDEEVASDVLMGRLNDAPRARPDMILCVLDATNLKRNLFLYSQIIELGLPVLVVLTMTDLTAAASIRVDIAALERKLGVPVVTVVGHNRNDIARLKLAIQAALQRNSGSVAPPVFDSGFPTALEDLVTQLQSRLAPFFPLGRFEARQLLLGDRQGLAARIGENGAAGQILRELREKGRDLALSPAVITVARYRWVEATLKDVEFRERDAVPRLSARLDSILTHRVFGLAAFAGVMYLVFRAIYTWATPFMDMIDLGTGALGDLVGALLRDTPMLQSLLVDGVIAGVGSVVIFLPQIIILFLFIAFLEDSGYLSRAAFLMDRLLGWTGLNGRAFIPMLSSFACAVPGVMAARVMPDPRARLTTILVAPLMSCSARLPVYLLMISAFIEPHFGPGWAAATLFGMHGLGLVVALPVAYILNRGVLKTPAIPFVLELPSYRMPSLFNVCYRAYEAARKFLVRAGTVIFAMSIVIWALSYFPRPDSVARSVQSQPEYAALSSAEVQTRLENEIAGAYLEQSYLGRLGHAVQPIFEPLGFDWKISVGILGAFPAREVIIATLGIIYNAGAGVDEESDTLKERMAAETRADGSPVYTPLVAVTLMVFFALCSQCMSTLATVWRELNSWRWAAFLFVYMTALAYVFGLLVYQGGLALGLASV